MGVDRVDGFSHLQWANRVIEWEGRGAKPEEIYNMSVQELADRFNERADAKSEPDDESCDDEEIDQMIEDAKQVKAEYKELLKAKKKKAGGHQSEVSLLLLLLLLLCIFDQDKQLFE